MEFTPRPATDTDYEPLTALWATGWHEAHAGHVPDALARLRTRPDFLRRLKAFGDDLRVVGPEGAPLGFCAVQGDHLDQLYVSPAARGTGAAKILIDDGAMRIRSAGYDMALLDCVVENHRARAFYRKAGWEERGVDTAILQTSEGPFEMDCMIFQKRL